MELRRINEDTVCCILTKEDMQDFGVELEDFLMNKEKTQEILHRIVEQAGEELGFDAGKGMLSLQIMPLPDQGISITFSESGQLEVADLIEQMKRVLGNLGEVRKELEKKDKSGKKKKKQDNQKEDSYLRIYEFASIEQAAKFCSYIPAKNKVISQFYKDNQKNTYILVFEKSKLSKQDFANVCSKAIEYGKYVSDSPVRAAYMEEHLEHIIEEKAVKMLRKFAQNG